MASVLKVLRSRRGFAVAAVGMTFTVGAGVTTLASWSQQQYLWGGTGATNALPGGANGIAASLFGVEESVDGGATFASQSSGTGAQLSFSATAGALSPDTTTYAYAQVRTVVKSIGGTVSLSGATNYGSSDTTLFDAMTYGAKSGMAAADCTASGYGSPSASTSPGAAVLVPAGTALGTGSGSTTFPLGAASSTAAGTPVGVCFALTLPASATTAVSGKTSTPLWHFNAVSN